MVDTNKDGKVTEDEFKQGCKNGWIQEQASKAGEAGGGQTPDQPTKPDESGSGKTSTEPMQPKPQWFGASLLTEVFSEAVCTCLKLQHDEHPVRGQCQGASVGLAVMTSSAVA